MVENDLPAELAKRSSPTDLEAEMGVLGSILLMPETADEVAMLVRPDDFSSDANRRIYQHMKDMHDEGGRIDITLLVDRLKTAGDFEVAGGAAYLYKISQSVPNAAHAKYYARIVQEKATFRSVIKTCTDILEEAYDPTREAKQLLSDAEQQIFAILDNRGSATVSSIKDILLATMDRIDARMSGEHASGGVETGFADLDAMLGGMRGSELLILAARPSMGKTACAMNISEHVALNERAPVLFVSLEMAAIELADRLLCSVARVSGHRLRNGSISNAARQQLVEKASLISQAPLYVDDSPSRTVSEIAAAARRIRRQCDSLGLIVIDYLQLIEPDNPRDPRQEQVAKIARRLKGMARELNVPVLCLAQLNRQAEDSREHIPRLSHLRESGAIEQDADVVMFVHREEYYLTAKQREDPNNSHLLGLGQIIIAKQRNGPVGDVELQWQKDFTRFENLDKRHSEFDEFSGEF